MHGAPEHRVAEGAGRHRLQLPVAFLAHRLRRLLEQEEFKFRRRIHAIPQAGGPLEYAPQRAARTDRLGAPRELAEIQGRFRLEGNIALGCGQDPHRGIGVGGVPAGERRVVIQLVVRVPAENHVAESQILIERRHELIASEIFPAQDSVGIEDPDLDVLDATLGQKVASRANCTRSSPARLNDRCRAGLHP